ncbi:MAG TPA: methyltransferase domain-containing protein [Stenomitos sp.]
MLLNPDQRMKLDTNSDALFYDYPRFVTHVDEGFIAQLTEVYRQYLRPQMHVLDLMSSWVSHLPDEMEFAVVEGHGMNAEELARNPRLNHYVVQDLNQSPQLPYREAQFDAVLIAVSVQYLQYPEAIFAEICRVLRPQGVAIVSFSNRMFFQKAIQIWRDRSEAGRVELVKQYFQAIPGFEQVETISRPAPLGGMFQSLGFAGADPFYAVIAHRRAMPSGSN